jgi:hypothetical protein
VFRRIWVLAWGVASLLSQVDCAWAVWGGFAPRYRIGPTSGLTLNDTSEAPLSADGRFFYVPTMASDEVWVYDLSSPLAPLLVQRAITGDFLATDAPTQAVLSDDGSTLGVLNSQSETVSLFDVNTVTGRLVLRGTFAPAGASFFSGNNLALNYNGSKGVIASGGTNIVYSFDATQTGTYSTAISALATTGRPHQIVLSRFGGRVLVVCIGGANAVDIFDRNSFTGVMTKRGTFHVPGSVGLLNGAVLTADERWGVITSSSANGLYTFDTSLTGDNSTPFQTFATPDQPRYPFLNSSESLLGVVCRPSIAIYENANLGLLFLTPRGEFAPGGVQNYVNSNNLALDDSGTVGYVAQGYIGILNAFDATRAGTFADSISRAPVGSQPNHLSISQDRRRLAVLSFPGTVDVFDANPLEISLTRRGEFDFPNADYTDDTVPAVSGDGSRGFVVDARSGQLLSFDSSVFGVQTSALDMEPTDPGSRGVSLSHNGSRAAVLAGAAGTGIFFDVDLPTGALSALGHFMGGVPLIPQALATWRGDGSVAYLPVAGENALDVVDPLTGGVIQTKPTGTAEPMHAALSTDQSRLGVLCRGTPPRVGFFSVSPNGRNLSNSGNFIPSSAGWDETNIPAISRDGRRFFVASNGEGILRSIDATLGGNFSSVLGTGQTGDNPAGLSLSGDGTRVAVVVPGENRVAFFDVVPGTGELARRGSAAVDLDNYTVANNVALTRDGVVALISTQKSVEANYLRAFDARLPGDPPPSTPPLGSQYLLSDGGKLALSADQRTVLVVETNRTSGDAVDVFGLGLGDPPQLVRATLFELSGLSDGIGEPGDIVALTFDQPIDLLASQSTSMYDFYLTNGGNLGSPVPMEIAPWAPNVALLTLGPGTSGVVAPGSNPTVSTFIDIGAYVSPPLFVSALNGQPARDLGQPFLDDSGVDLRRNVPSRTTHIDALLGGIADLPRNRSQLFPDYGFDGHRLIVPPRSLRMSADFTLGPPPMSILNLGIPSAFRITTNAEGAPNNIFGTPATLVGEYDPAEVDIAAGQLEHLMAIFQIPGDGGSPVRLPAVQMVDTTLKTVSVPITGLNPAGFGMLRGAGAATSAIEPLSTADGVGTFATLPVNPVEQRSIFIAAGGGTSAAIATLATSTVATLSGGSGGAYTLHQIEFPGYQTTTASDPNRIEVTIRTATLFERTAFGSGQSFPSQSGAIFAVTTRNAGGSPVAFSAPVNITVQFIERTSDAETDTVAFTGARGMPVQMRPVHDVGAGTDVDFTWTGGDPLIDQTAGTLTLQAYAGLTGSDGLGVFGAVIDPSAPTSVSRERLIQYLLGQVTLSNVEKSLANFNGDDVIDIADVVADVNP